MSQGAIKGQVNAGCLLFIPQTCTDQLRKDSEDLILYTQLAATKKHSRFVAAEEWKKRWMEALVQFGAVLNRYESMSRPAADLGLAAPWDWVTKHLPAFMSAQPLMQSGALAQHSFTRYPDQPAVHMLARHGLQNVVEPGASLPLEAQRVGLQFCLVGPASTLELGVLSFSHRTPLTADALFRPLKADDIIGNIELSFYSMRLMDIVYASFRGKLDEQLKDRRIHAISPLTGETP